MKPRSRKLIRDVVRILPGAIALLCGSETQPVSAQAPVEVLVERDTVQFDRDMRLRVTGLNPGSETLLTISVTDAQGQDWWSQNVYLADEAGHVDLSRQEPIRGTYSGRHSMGPF